MRRLKRGVALYATESPDHYLVGTHKRTVRIESASQKTFIKLLVDGLSDSEIHEFLEGLPIAERQSTQKLIAELDALEICEKRKGILALSKRFISGSEGRATRNSRPERDAAFIQLQTRVTPELSQTTWQIGSDDGGIELLSKRQDIVIEISGNNRVATILYSILIASGATQTRFTRASRDSASLVRDLDIAVGSFTSSHIGYVFERHCEVLRRELSLFPLDKETHPLDEFATPDLRVHCGEMDPEKLALWMSSSQPFFYIPSPRADSAEIGPCVIPGSSPCLRCVELVRRDQTGITDYLPLHEANGVDYPIVAAYAVAAIAASQILTFAAKRSSEITGKVISLDYQALANPQTMMVNRHPLCGCAFQTSDSSNRTAAIT
jgi:hypothetical protein